MTIYAVTLESLTPDQVRQLDALVGQVMAHGFGTVTISIEKGRTRRVTPAPSLPFEGDTNERKSDERTVRE